VTDLVNVDDRMLPRRQPKGLLPSTWQGRALDVEYQTSDGHSATIAGAKLLEMYPFGPVFSMNGTKTAISWDCIRVIEMQSG
jgi:hypothetical protein